MGSDDLRHQPTAGALALSLTESAATAVLRATWTPSLGYENIQAALAIDDAATSTDPDPDRTWPSAGGVAIPGSAAIVGCSTATRTRDWQPSAQALAATRDNLGVALRESLVVGDRLRPDLAWTNGRV